MKTRLAQTDKAQTRQKRTTPKAKDEGTLLFFPDAQEGTLLLFLHAQTLIQTDESESTIILTHSKALVSPLLLSSIASSFFSSIKSFEKENPSPLFYFVEPGRRQRVEFGVRVLGMCLGLINCLNVS